MEKGKRHVVVSALQFACTDDIPTNLATAERLVRAAHEKGANIILIQELFEGYYFCQAQREDFFQRAKPYKDHPTIQRMQKLAKELGVVIPVSFFEEANNAHYNSVAIIDADGTDLGLYRKSHIPDGPGYQEKFYFNPGDTGFKVFQTKFAKIGVGICWDQWFPEAARAMVLQGAEILFYPTAIGSEPQDEGLDSCDHWQRVMQGHAGANVVPLVASNRIGKEMIETEHGNSEITFYGNSFIAGPTGEIVAAANDKEEAVLIAHFDLGVLLISPLFSSPRYHRPPPKNFAAPPGQGDDGTLPFCSNEAVSRYWLPPGGPELSMRGYYSIGSSCLVDHFFRRRVVQSSTFCSFDIQIYFLFFYLSLLQPKIGSSLIPNICLLTIHQR
ncbi:Nitrilase-like protein 1 isoform 1 [Theobroma cacao]|uniref:Nitrilase-like protein 1 isoform 1 n=1 Tax=Theobroma cacao TaxID=3641 RepID=A0A061GZP8_THECC|nr:Nitrilase-like protein 1 isoform 1 [Theobroma cacao]